MTRLLLLVFITAFISCSTKNEKTNNKTELVKQYDYRIIIDIWNGFAGQESKYILNNLRIYTYDSTDLRFKEVKPLTLYYISHIRENDSTNPNIRILVPTDTTEIPFSKKLSDTLFELTRNFLKSVEFNNYDTSINGVVTKPIITDDSQAMVEMNYDGRKLSATISSINNPTIATNGLDTLLNFIRKFKPIDKK
jgi:hypothetical protein